MKTFENLDRLTAITRRMPKSPWRKLTFAALLFASTCAAADLAFHDAKHNGFGIVCALLVAGISVYVLATGYAVKRF